MSDILIQNVGNQASNVQIRSGPVYMIELAGTSKQPNHYHFIAIKLDEAQNTAKVTGFFSNAKCEEIIGNYTEMVSSVKQEDVVEMSFPWQRVFSIRNLIYRFKGNK